MKTDLRKPLRSQAERDKLIEQYLPLVKYVVARLPVSMPATLDRDDFFSVGVLGLMHAASAYDPTRGASFKTFAYTAIRGAVLDEIRKLDPVPRNRRDRLRKLDKASAELRVVLDREPTHVELAEILGIEPHELDNDLQALHTGRVLSLDEPSGRGSPESLGSMIADQDSIDPTARVATRDAIEQLTKAISELPDTERHVVVLYFHEQLFLKEIGQVLGVTESRVSQILTRAVERLRMKLRVCEQPTA
ncbi:MAG: FliA/WhiG family RNA polymerase sigma factor [Planctomycetota bacterium]|nr:FliA/WhiG family RNA polymerase sigma factor [Planctomycetota bacterium]